MIRQICLVAFFGTALLAPAVLVWAGEPRFERTTVAIDGTRWLINGCVTYPGAKAEGLLMNVRMVNALKQYGKPIVCNEDDKTGQAAAEACRLSVENGAS